MDVAVLRELAADVQAVVQQAAQAADADPDGSGLAAGELFAHPFLATGGPASDVVVDLEIVFHTANIYIIRCGRKDYKHSQRPRTAVRVTLSCGRASPEALAEESSATDETGSGAQCSPQRQRPSESDRVAMSPSWPLLTR